MQRNTHKNSTIKLQNFKNQYDQQCCRIEINKEKSTVFLCTSNGQSKIEDNSIYNSIKNNEE